MYAIDTVSRSLAEDGSLEDLVVTMRDWNDVEAGTVTNTYNIVSNATLIAAIQADLDDLNA